MSAAADPVLDRFRAAVRRTYGDRLGRVVLYGSRARGEGRPDSDYDLAVFLKAFDGFGAESRRLAEIETDILYDTGAVVNALPFRLDAEAERTGFMAEVHRDGVEL